MKKLIFLISVILLYLTNAYSQEKKAGIQSLSIGDKVSDAVWNIPLQVVNHEDGKEKITLNDYKNKLIILDFWATWCGSCIAAMPRIHQLEQQFSKEVIVFPVAYESKKQISQFIKANKTLSPLNLISIIEDTVLMKVFPHRFIPHYVWIYNGKISSITDAKDITEANISTILSGRLENWDIKEDVLGFNRKIPLLKNQSSRIIQNLMFNSLLTKYIPGIGASSGYSTDSISKRIYFINRPIMAFYEYAFNYSFKNRIILNVSDRQRFEFIKGNGIFWGNWAKGNAHCYEITVPLNTTEIEIKQIVLQDINRYLGLRAKVEKRKVKCFVVVSKDRTNKSKLIDEASSETLIESRFNSYNAGGPINPVIINESGFIRDIKIENYTGDISMLRKELKVYDLDLISEVRELDCLVVSDNK